MPFSKLFIFLLSKIDIEELLTKMFESVVTSTDKLTQTTDSFIHRVGRAWDSISPYFDYIQEKSHFLWGLGLNASLTTLIVTLIIYGAFLLGISHEERAARVTFVLGTVLLSVASIGLAIFTIFIMLIGGHGELFLCRQMYDGPNYQVVSQLIDRPGLLYANETNNGIIFDLLQNGNDTIPINTTLAAAITQCERSDATYDVFHLERILNVSKIIDLQEYDDLDDAIEKIFVSSARFLSLTEPLERIFDYMFANSDIDFNLYRAELSRPTPEKDLITFIDQMQRVSVQVILNIYSLITLEISYIY